MRGSNTKPAHQRPGPDPTQRGPYRLTFGGGCSIAHHSVPSQPCCTYLSSTAKLTPHPPRPPLPHPPPPHTHTTPHHICQITLPSAPPCLQCAPVMAFTAVMVLVHWAVVFSVGPALGLPLQALLIGSNACVGAWHNQLSKSAASCKPLYTLLVGCRVSCPKPLAWPASAQVVRPPLEALQPPVTGLTSSSRLC